MEIFRDLALADYENLGEEDTMERQTTYNEWVANGRDFSGFFRTQSKRVSNWLDSFDVFEKQNWDFEEFLTVLYIYENKKALILCRGCSSLLTGTAYLTCRECFFDPSEDRTFDLCCNCYRSKNFKDHRHTVFSSIHLMTHRCKEKLAMKEIEEEIRNEAINKALAELGKDFAKFGKSIAHDSDEWMKKHSGTTDALSPPKKEDSDEDDDSRPRGRNHIVDFLGVTPTVRPSRWSV